MSAGTWNILIEQGATFDTTLTWKDEAGTPVNLTGYTARMQIRPEVGSSTVTLDLTTANGRIALGGAAGTIRLTIDAATTAALLPSVQVHDLELVVGSTVTRLLRGSVTIDPEVTR